MELGCPWGIGLPFAISRRFNKIIFKIRPIAHAQPRFMEMTHCFLAINLDTNNIKDYTKSYFHMEIEYLVVSMCCDYIWVNPYKENNIELKLTCFSCSFTSFSGKTPARRNDAFHVSASSWVSADNSISRWLWYTFLQQYQYINFKDTWAVSRQKVPNVRMGERGRVHSAFGMTTTFQKKIYKKSVSYQKQDGRGTTTQDIRDLFTWHSPHDKPLKLISNIHI